MKRCLFIMGLLAVLAGWGCSVVVSSKPVGDMPLVIDPAEWEGTWTAADGDPVVIKAGDAGRGQLKLAWIEGNKEMVLKTATVVIMKSGAWHLASLREDAPGQSPGAYFFARVKKQRGLIIVWLPRPERFAGLVNERILPGTVSGERVLLDDLRPEHMKIIASEDRGLLFDWENPVVLMRAGGR